jgi:hypothetical protein
MMPIDIKIKLNNQFASEVDYWTPSGKSINTLKYAATVSDNNTDAIDILITEDWPNNMMSLSSAEIYLRTQRSVEKNLDCAISRILDDMINSGVIDISTQYSGWLKCIPKCLIRKKVVKQIVEHIIERSKWYLYVPHYGIEPFYLNGFDKYDRAKGMFKQIEIDLKGESPPIARAIHQIPDRLLSFI